MLRHASNLQKISARQQSSPYAGSSQSIHVRTGIPNPTQYHLRRCFAGDLLADCSEVDEIFAVHINSRSRPALQLSVGVELPLQNGFEGSYLKEHVFRSDVMRFGAFWSAPFRRTGHCQHGSKL